MSSELIKFSPLPAMMGTGMGGICMCIMRDVHRTSLDLILSLLVD